MVVPAGEICFVSAHAWDAADAVGFGFRVANLNRFGQPPEGLLGRPRVGMRTLADLPTLLPPRRNGAVPRPSAIKPIATFHNGLN